MTNRFDINRSQLSEFLDDIEDLPRHIVMFYEEPEHARMVAFRFIKNGLDRGDHCTYEIPLEDEDHKELDRITNSDLAPAKAFIEQEMRDYEINTTYYKDKGLLSFYSFRDNNISTFDSFRKAIEHNHKTYLDQFGSESKFPSLRAIGRPIADINTNDRLAPLLQIERYFQNDKVAKSVSNKSTSICTYKLNDIMKDIDDDKEKPWIKELLQIHDAVIYLSRNNKGVVLRLK